MLSEILHFGGSRTSALPPYPPLPPVGTHRCPCTAFNHGLHRLNCSQHQVTSCNVRALCESYRSYFILAAPVPAPPRHPPPCPVWFTKVALALHLMLKLLFLFDSNSVCPAEMLPTKRGQKPSIGTNDSHHPFLQNQMSFHVL